MRIAFYLIIEKYLEYIPASSTRVFAALYICMRVRVIDYWFRVIADGAAAFMAWKNETLVSNRVQQSALSFLIKSRYDQFAVQCHAQAIE